MERKTEAQRAYCAARIASADTALAREAAWSRVAQIGGYARPPAASTFARWIEDAEDMHQLSIYRSPEVEARNA